MECTKMGGPCVAGTDKCCEGLKCVKMQEGAGATMKTWHECNHCNAAITDCFGY